MIVIIGLIVLLVAVVVGMVGVLGNAVQTGGIEIALSVLGRAFGARSSALDATQFASTLTSIGS